MRKRPKLSTRILIIGFGVLLTITGLLIAPHTRGLIKGYWIQQQVYREIRRTCNPQSERELLYARSDAVLLDERARTPFMANYRNIIEILLTNPDGSRKSWATDRVWAEQDSIVSRYGASEAMWFASKDVEMGRMAFLYQKHILVAEAGSFVTIGVGVILLGLFCLPWLIVLLIIVIMAWRGLGIQHGIPPPAPQTEPRIEYVTGGDGAQDSAPVQPVEPSPTIIWFMLWTNVIVAIIRDCRSAWRTIRTLGSRAPPFPERIAPCFACSA